MPSLSDYLYKYPLLPFAIKFTVKDLFPSTKIKFSFSYGNHHLTAHYLALHMGVGIILIPVMSVLFNWGMGCKFFQPHLIVMV